MNDSDHTLLIVDDDQSLRAALSHWAKKEGYIAHVAASRTDARAFLEDHPIDLVILDLHLPDSNGLPFARDLIDANPERPVIIVTADAALDSAREAIGIGVYEYYIKPIDFEQLRNAVAGALAHRAVLIQNRVRQTERLARANAELQREVSEQRQQEEALELANRRLQQKDRLLTAFQQIAPVSLATLDADEILERLIRSIVEAGILRSLSVALVDYQGEYCEVVRSVRRMETEAGTDPEFRSDFTSRRRRLDGPAVEAEVVRLGTLRVIDRHDDPRLDPVLEAKPWEDKVAYFFPVKCAGEVIAVLGTGSKRAEREETIERIRMMEPLLDQVGVGLRHARLYRSLEQTTQALRERDRLLAAYNSIARVAISSLNMDEIVERVGRQIVHAGIFRSLMIALVDEDEQTVEVVRSFVHSKVTPEGIASDSVLLSTSPVVGLRYDLNDDNVTAETARTGNLRVVEGLDDTRLDRRVDRHAERWVDKVAYFIPVKTEERVLAVLATGSTRAEQEPTLAQIDAMGPMLTQVAIALEHARLYRSAHEYAEALANINKELELEIGERQRAEEAVVRLERLSALGEMSAGVSHNLNNILTGILGPAELIETLTDAPDVLQEADVIRRSALRARDLVARLHQSVRGEDQLVQAVNLSSAIGEAVEAARPRWKDVPEAEGRTISLDTELQPVPRVRCTPSGMHDLLLNLIFNAVDAMPDGGTLRIVTERVQDSIRLTVSDTGLGMPEDVRARVFEPFFTTKADVGTGLGLSTVYGSVMRWNGQIDVESEPGQGTSFHVDLAEWEGEESGPSEDDRPPSPTRSGRLLVVEDEEIVSEVVSRMLARQHTVDVASTGEEALNKAAANKYDVALIDLGMPGMPGDRVAEELRQSDASIATVLMTGWALADDDPRLSVFDFRIQKPFVDVDRLQDIVAQAIVRHDSRIR